MNDDIHQSLWEHILVHFGHEAPCRPHHLPQKLNRRKMHSSRMHTARLLTVSPIMHSSGGGPGTGIVPGLGGVFGPGGCTWSLGDSVPDPGRGVPGPGGIPGTVGCTWSQASVPGPSGGVYRVLGGVPGPRGVPGRGGTCPGTSQVDRMTDNCKNITLPQTSFAGGKYYQRNYLDCKYWTSITLGTTKIVFTKKISRKTLNLLIVFI